MDIWQKMYDKAKEQYHPEEVSPLYMHIMSYVLWKLIMEKSSQAFALKAAAEF